MKTVYVILLLTLVVFAGTGCKFITLQPMPEHQQGGPLYGNR
jgi:hypothetical protein